MEREKDNPGHGFVPLALCAEARDHLNTKIDNMGKSIRWSIYIASSVLGLILLITEYAHMVTHL